jgi:D-3-phosphoglycerate dehydrogenase
MQNIVDERAVNLVNAQHVASERGIETASTHVSSQHESREEIELRMRAGTRSLRVAGALLGESPVRITRIGEFRVDVAPRGTLLVLQNRDVPGVIGRVGTLLGEAGVNIAEYHQARLEAGGEALAAVQIDTTVPGSLLEQLCALPEMRDAKQVVMD